MKSGLLNTNNERERELEKNDRVKTEIDDEKIAQRNEDFGYFKKVMIYKKLTCLF